MSTEIKDAIVRWLLDHENEWQRVNSCVAAFRAYIYDTSGNYLLGGRAVSEFISAADKLLYPRFPL